MYNKWPKPLQIHGLHFIKDIMSNKVRLAVTKSKNESNRKVDKISKATLNEIHNNSK